MSKSILKYEAVTFSNRPQLQGLLDDFLKDGWKLDQMNSSCENGLCIGFAVFKLEVEDGDA